MGVKRGLLFCKVLWRI